MKKQREYLSVVTAYLDSDGWHDTDQYLETAARLAELRAAGYTAEVVDGGCGDGGDYISVGDVIEYWPTPTLLVGRHAGDVPGLDVVVQENVTFSLTIQECERQINDLVRTAKDAGAKALVLQNTPGIVAAALGRAHRNTQDEWLPLDHTEIYGIKVGVIISRPGPRLGGATREFQFPLLQYADGGPLISQAGTAEEAVRFASGRAKTALRTDPPDALAWQQADVLSVTVDPVSPFEFDHIEWL